MGPVSGSHLSWELLQVPVSSAPRREGAPHSAPLLADWQQRETREWPGILTSPQAPPTSYGPTSTLLSELPPAPDPPFRSLPHPIFPLAPRPPFTLNSWELLLEGFSVLWGEEAKALELAGAELRPEAQLLSVLDEAVWVVPAVDHAQLGLLRVQHLLGQAYLALWENPHVVPRGETATSGAAGRCGTCPPTEDCAPPGASAPGFKWDSSGQLCPCQPTWALMMGRHRARSAGLEQTEEGRR